MKKKIVLVVVAFFVCSALIKVWGITNKYELGIFEYFNYSESISYEEREFLKNSIIHYGVDMNDAPFAFTDQAAGIKTGLLIDYFNQLSVTLESTFQPIHYNNYHLAVKLKDGEIDAAVINRTQVTEQIFAFTQPLYKKKDKLLVHGESKYESVHEVNNIKIAVIAGSTAHHAANKFFLRNGPVKLVLAKDLEECFYLFGMGHVDAILGDEAKISYYLNQALSRNFLKFLDGAISETEMAIAVNPDQKKLLSILNKGILEMKKNEQYSHIHSKWFGSFIPEIKYFPNINIASNLFITVLAVVAALYVWSQTVREIVDSRTRELKESRQELRDILDSLKNGLIVTDVKGNIQVCNETALRIIGLSSDFVIDRKLNEVTELDPFLAHIDEKDALRIDHRHYLVTHRQLDIASGKNILIIEDYTDRYQYERLTRQEAKMIAVGELSAGLAHEIRNPLGLIRSYSFLLRKKTTEKMSVHSLNVIDDSVDRINHLIENLLGFSRLSLDKNILLNAEDLLTALVSLERKNLEKAGIEIQMEFLWESGPCMNINEDVIKLTIVNLINNSIDALSQSGKKQKKIYIKAKTEEDYFKIDFCDNGTGISKENLEEVFNPFFTTKDNGTGLGLYILDSEIRNADGSISVESTEGEGTCFHIIMPIERIGQNE